MAMSSTRSEPAEVQGSAHHVGELVDGGAAIPSTTPVGEVADRFSAAPALSALALVDDGRPAGLITRPRLLSRLARNLGYPLVWRKPVAQIADRWPLVLPERTAVGEALARALARPDDSVYDEVIAVRDDGAFWGILSVRRLVLQQAIVLTRSRLERAEALSRAADLERLDLQRSRFLAHATHELRSPVGVISAATHLVRRAADQGDWEQVERRLPQLLRAATRLRGTVENVLDLSRLEAGTHGARVQDVEVGELLDEVAAAGRLLSGSKGVVVEIEAAGAPVRIRSDLQKLWQILLNLVSNAAKFTDRGRIEVGAEARDGIVRFWVSDTGIGIRQDDLARIFVPFGQVRDARPGAKAGTGLGLVIARSLAEILGGRLDVTSRPGQGTTFSLVLPEARTSGESARGGAPDMQAAE
jgi:signal transduction histidine kinase